MGILRTVRAVARETSLNLNHLMFIHEWSRLPSVTFCTGCIYFGDRPLLFSNNAMRIVTNGTLNSSFCHRVMREHGKVGCHICVALQADFRLSQLEQFSVVICTMDTVAAHTTQFGLAVKRVCELGKMSRVTSETCLIDLFDRRLCGIEDLCFVPAAIHMLFPRPMARVAPISV